jgi:hypothetical protein
MGIKFLDLAREAKQLIEEFVTKNTALGAQDRL